MANSYFQFKEFIVQQEKTAMKVCTDACVFGAYVASIERFDCNNEMNVLDIGAGTGLLSLMIAQKMKGNIEAVEIDNKAFEQAKKNFENSPWLARLSVHHADITKFNFNKKYNIIVSNPPFYEKSLKSIDSKKNLAKHNFALPYEALASVASNNLLYKGRFYILLPFNEFFLFEKIASQNQLKLLEKVNLKQSEHSDYFRTIGVFSKQEEDQVVNEKILAIKNENNRYTQNFIALLKDYYLYL